MQCLYSSLQCECCFVMQLSMLASRVEEGQCLESRDAECRCKVKQGQLRYINDRKTRSIKIYK